MLVRIPVFKRAFCSSTNTLQAFQRRLSTGSKAGSHSGNTALQATAGTQAVPRDSSSVTSQVPHSSSSRSPTTFNAAGARAVVTGYTRWSAGTPTSTLSPASTTAPIMHRFRSSKPAEPAWCTHRSQSQPTPTVNYGMTVDLVLTMMRTSRGCIMALLTTTLSAFSSCQTASPKHTSSTPTERREMGSTEGWISPRCSSFLTTSSTRHRLEASVEVITFMLCLACCFLVYNTTSESLIHNRIVLTLRSLCDKSKGYAKYSCEVVVVHHVLAARGQPHALKASFPQLSPTEDGPPLVYHQHPSNNHQDPLSGAIDPPIVGCRLVPVVQAGWPRGC
jgi:hypothetical protein